MLSATASASVASSVTSDTWRLAAISVEVGKWMPVTLMSCCEVSSRSSGLTASWGYTLCAQGGGRGQYCIEMW